MIKNSCSYHFSCKLFTVPSQFQLKSLSNYFSFFVLLSYLCVCVTIKGIVVIEEQPTGTKEKV